MAKKLGLSQRLSEEEPCYCQSDCDIPYTNPPVAKFVEKTNRYFKEVKRRFPGLSLRTNAFDLSAGLHISAEVHFQGEELFVVQFWPSSTRIDDEKNVRVLIAKMPLGVNNMEELTLIQWLNSDRAFSFFRTSLELFFDRKKNEIIAAQEVLKEICR